jgi:hypothetical protein
LAAATFDYFGADQMSFFYRSQIQTAEANIIYPWSEVQLLLGYRYFGLDDQFTLQSSDDDDAFTSDYDVSTVNQMHGAQIGVLGQFEALGLVNFDLAGKFGVVANASRQSQTVRDLNNTDLFRATSGERTDVAFVSELRAQAIFPLGPVWSVQTGYTIFFVNRVALAPEQYDLPIRPPAAPRSIREAISSSTESIWALRRSGNGASEAQNSAKCGFRPGRLTEP